MDRSLVARISSRWSLERRVLRRHAGISKRAARTTRVTGQGNGGWNSGKTG